MIEDRFISPLTGSPKYEDPVYTVEIFPVGDYSRKDETEVSFFEGESEFELAVIRARRIKKQLIESGQAERWETLVVRLLDGRKFCVLRKEI